MGAGGRGIVVLVPRALYGDFVAAYRDESFHGRLSIKSDMYLSLHSPVVIAELLHVDFQARICVNICISCD